MTLTNMTLQEKLGQIFMIGFPGTEVTDELRDLILRYKFGNIILFARNLRDSAQIARLTSSLQELVQQATGHPALISIDQEGGSVTRLPADCVNMPGNMALASLREPEIVEQACFLAGTELLRLGINFNLAPVLDLAGSRKNPAIGTRSFGDDPREAAVFARAAVRGYRKSGVISCGKHFPGHGDVDEDSHVSLPLLRKSWAELEKRELVPFRAAIEAGLDSVMIAHILFPRIENRNVPATMSKTIIREGLRKKLNFHGLITTDCLEMDAISRFYGTEKGAAAALRAGADLILVSHRPALAESALNEIRRQLADGTIPEERLNDAVEHVLVCKQRLSGISMYSQDLRSFETGKETAETFLRATIRWRDPAAASAYRLGNAPLFIGFRTVNPSKAVSKTDDRLYFELTMQKSFGGQALTLPRDPGDAELQAALKMAKNCTSVVLGTRNAYLYPGQAKAVRAMEQSGKPVIAAALGNPYDLELFAPGTAALAAYEYSARVFRIIAEMLTP